MRDDEILINQWLADDLRAGPGDGIAVDIFHSRHGPPPGGKTNRFPRLRDSAHVRRHRGRTLLPDFPGIARRNPPPIGTRAFLLTWAKSGPRTNNTGRITAARPKPLSPSPSGQRMWGNRFGNATAVRYPGQTDPAAASRALLSSLIPDTVGLAFLPVRAQALAAAATGQAQEFGMLFLSFSFFLITGGLDPARAAFFNWASKSGPKRLASCWPVGWRPAQVRRLLLWEGAAVALLGALLGLGGRRSVRPGHPVGFDDLVERGPWPIPRCVSTSAQPPWPAAGAATVLVGLAVMWLALRAQTKRPARELLEQGNEIEARLASGRGGRRWAGWLAWASLLGALATAGAAFGQRDNAAAVGIFLRQRRPPAHRGPRRRGGLFRSLAEPRASRPLSLAALGVRGCAPPAQAQPRHRRPARQRQFPSHRRRGNKLDAHTDSAQTFLRHRRFRADRPNPPSPSCRT